MTVTWDMLQLREPLWLLLALQPVLLSLYVSLQYRRQNNLYADAMLLPWVITRTQQGSKGMLWLRFLLLQLCWILIAVAMAGPRYPDPPRDADRAGAADVMLLIDVSRSMTATDVTPDRLQRVKTEVFRFLSENRSDRIGIILFAGHAHLLSPLTWDHKALRFYAKGIEAGLLPTAGSHLAEAITLANQQLAGSNAPAILLLTDGETHTPIDTTPDIIQTPLYIMGVGSHAGATIAASEGGWLMHENKPVRTRLQDTQLQALASSSGGAYSELNNEPGGLNALYHRSLVANAFKQATASADQSWIELYHWLLLPALLLLLLMSLPLPLLSARLANLGVVCLLVSAGLLQPMDAGAQGMSIESESAAYAAYQTQDYRKAMDIYAVHSGYVARMGEGSSAYQLKDHARAITQFTRAFLVADDDRYRAKALYNLANSYFQVENYTSAIAVYTDVLQYDQQHQEAQANLDFVKSVLASKSQDAFASSARAQRAGKGPRSLKTDDNTRGGGDFSLDDEEVALTPSARADRQLQDTHLLERIASGKERVQVAGEAAHVQVPAGVAVVNASQLLQARRLITEGKRDQSRLWKSLFEEEEGFPAPLQQPVSEAGVPPW